MLLEKLRSQGIAEALEAIGYDCERIFGELTPEAEELYASYSWRKISCSVEGIRDAYVIHAVPSEELLKEDHPWEEWFFQFGRPKSRSGPLAFFVCGIRAGRHCKTLMQTGSRGRERPREH